MGNGHPGGSGQDVGRSAGALLQLIRAGRADTRADLARLSGLARSTVSQRVDALLDSGLIYEDGEAPSSGGRPPTRLSFNDRAGVVLAADLGATQCHLAVVDLAGSLLAEHAQDLAIADGPDAVLSTVTGRFDELLAEAGHADEQVRGVGMGLPGPVEFSAGRAVNPPIMPGWDGFDVPAHMQQRWPVPVRVDNDVNIMALGEYRTVWVGELDDLLFIKVGTGIGCGIVTGGRIQRGAQGAAGDLGHIAVDVDDPHRCRCGNVGCLEAEAGGAALARDLTARGTPADHTRDVAAAARAGNADAVHLVRRGGRLLGEVLAGAVNLLNPGVIVIGGDLAVAQDQLLAGVREVIYERSTALATRHLRMERSRLGDGAGGRGAAALILDLVRDPGAVDAAIAAGRDAP